MTELPTTVTADEVRARRDHPYVVALPSGMTVQIRRMALIELAAAGRIPDEMTTATLIGLAEALDEARDKPATEARRTMNQRLELIDAVCIAMLVAPRMTATGDGDSIAPRDLSFRDRTYLYGIALGTQEGPNLARFPGGPGADVDALADGPGVREPAVGAAGGS